MNNIDKRYFVVMSKDDDYMGPLSRTLHETKAGALQEIKEYGGLSTSDMLLCYWTDEYMIESFFVKSNDKASTKQDE
jgi:hypothetical protein